MKTYLDNGCVRTVVQNGDKITVVTEGQTFGLKIEEYSPTFGSIIHTSNSGREENVQKWGQSPLSKWYETWQTCSQPFYQSCVKETCLQDGSKWSEEWHTTAGYIYCHKQGISGEESWSEQWCESSNEDWCEKWTIRNTDGAAWGKNWGKRHSDGHTWYESWRKNDKNSQTVILEKR